MQNFEWAENNLNVQTPHELQDRGVQVYFAPNVPRGVEIVELGTGSVTRFNDNEKRSPVGYYANYDSLHRYAREHNLPFSESNGQISFDRYPTGRTSR
ncbi:MAG TPA: hypothetical protein VFB58_08975 [Chloroflexota bacterium]|nr:hypothetical protein [Chloroflexota bacterium]